jgi:D-cysteine desulfhydrase family pyridoxal phosphate-dependent enzyme
VRRRLAPWPTPLVAAPKLGAAIGLPDLWLKRDDLIAFGLGGNKIRGLEFLIADALARDADVILTGAGTQSNHVRATAAAAAHVEREMIAVYWGSRPERAAGNYALTLMLGATAVFTESDDRASVDVRLESLARELRARGRRPYVIPRGGACALGAVGHALAARELMAQTAEAHLAPDVLVLATGSGGTQAGLLAGVRALDLPWRIEGVTVGRPASEARARVLALARECAELAHLDAAFEARDVVVHEGFIGDGYGIPTPAGDAAIELAARTEGVFLDPTYTGKAFAGLLALAHEGRIRASESVVFVHTGGAPALLARDLETETKP